MDKKKPILVYVKTENDKRFNALSSLQKFTYAPTLMYAVLIPHNKLDTLKQWCDNLKHVCIKNNVKIELRQYKGKVLYKVG